MNKNPLPKIFSVRDALARGYTRNQIQRSSHYLVMSGIYAKKGAEFTLLELAQAFAGSEPQAVLTSLTAARLLDWRLPKDLGKDELYALTSDGGRIRKKKVVFSTSAIAEEEIVIYKKVRITCPERTLLELTKVLNLHELVILLDGLLCCHQHRQQIPISTREKILSFLEDRPGAQGAGKIRKALELAVTGSDSAMETELRLLLASYGVTGLACNLPVRTPSGMIAFEPDLADLTHKISIQYEGEHHGGRRQIRRDLERARRTVEAGWVEVRIFHDDLRFLEWSEDDRQFVPRAVQLVRQAIASRSQI